MIENRPAIEPPHAVAVGDGARPALGRPACRVVLDMRVPGVVGAIAVDRRNALRGWSVVGGGLEPGTLIHLALDRLAVKPRELRVLLGSRLVQVSPVSAVGAPSVDDVRETLEREGYSPGTGALAHGAVHCGGASWLAAACADDELAATARSIEEITSVGPDFVVDQLFLAANLEPGCAAIERTKAGLSVVAVGLDGAPLARFLTPAQATNLGSEVRRLLAFAELEDATVEFLGEGRDESAAAFDGEDGVAPARPLPGDADGRLPARLELPWRVALDASPPSLSSPYQREVRRRLTRASRLSAVGMLLALGGLVVAGLGYKDLLEQDARLDQVRQRHAGVDGRLKQLGELGGIARSAADLAVALEPQAPTWPVLHDTLSNLAQNRPARLGWEKLTVEDGTLELLVSAAGPTPDQELDAMAQSLRECVGLANISRSEITVDPKGLGSSLTYRARVLGGPGAAGEASR